ncbi:MAG: MerR family transcriptional regulator [Pseudomonadota bacterium]
MTKGAEAFRTISEVAEWLGVQTHVLRFWESKFTQVKPVKRAGGRRYYRPADMLLLGGIRKLLHEDGLTIKGVQKILREKGMAHVADLSPSLDEDAVDGMSIAQPAATAPEQTPSPPAADVEMSPDPVPEPAPESAESPPEFQFSYPDIPEQNADVEPDDAQTQAVDDPEAETEAAETTTEMAELPQSTPPEVPAASAFTYEDLTTPPETEPEPIIETPSDPVQPADPTPVAAQDTAPAQPNPETPAQQPEAGAGLPSFLSGAPKAEDPPTEVVAELEQAAAPEEIVPSPPVEPELTPVPEPSTSPTADPSGLPGFLTQTNPPDTPSIPPVEAPDPPLEADIETTPGPLSKLLRRQTADPATRAQLIPIAAQLTALRDRLAATR